MSFSRLARKELLAMAKIDEFINTVVHLLIEEKIQAFSDNYNLSLPEYIVVDADKFSVDNTIRLENGIAFSATLFCKLTVVCDKDHADTTDLECRAVAVISKRHPVKVKEIRYEIGVDFNRYIVDLEIGGFGWVQFDED
jgi:hypothetical protein